MARPPKDEPITTAQFIAAGKELLVAGKVTSLGAIYVGNLDIGAKHENVRCNVFALRLALKEIMGGIYSFDSTVLRTGDPNFKVEGRKGFRAQSATYRADLKTYLRCHVKKNAGNCDAQSDLFIPWVAALKSMVRIARTGKSDLVLPEESRNDNRNLLLSCDPEAGNPNGRGIVSAQTGGTDFFPRHRGMFGCVLFFATPVLG